MIEETKLFPVALKLENFGHGPWINEPDKVSLIHAGVQCYIVRSQEYGNLKATIPIPKKHSWYRKNGIPDVWDFEAHGPIITSFAGGNIFLKFYANSEDDLIPSEHAFEQTDKIYRTISYMIEKCKYLAEQIIEAHEPYAV